MSISNCLKVKLVQKLFYSCHWLVSLLHIVYCLARKQTCKHTNKRIVKERYGYTYTGFASDRQFLKSMTITFRRIFTFHLKYTMFHYLVISWPKRPYCLLKIHNDINSTLFQIDHTLTAPIRNLKMIRNHPSIDLNTFILKEIIALTTKGVYYFLRFQVIEWHGVQSDVCTRPNSFSTHLF